MPRAAVGRPGDWAESNDPRGSCGVARCAGVATEIFAAHASKSFKRAGPAASSSRRGVACRVLLSVLCPLDDTRSSMQAHALELDTSHDTQHEIERWAGVAVAAAMVAFGLSRRSVPGVVLAAAAAPLAYRSLTGRMARLGQRLCPRRHPRRARGLTRHSRPRSHPARTAARRGLRLLAPPREPAAVHEPPAVGDRPRRRAVALGGRTGRPARAVEWDAEIVNEVDGRGDRLAVVARFRHRHRRLGALLAPRARGAAPRCRCTCSTRRRAAASAAARARCWAATRRT